MKFFVLCLCFIFINVINTVDSLECGVRKIPVEMQVMGKRIVGGTEAKHGNWPWMVMLTLNDKYKCGGSILTERLILTAAHCISGLSAGKFKVIVGKHNKTTETADVTEQTFQVESYKIHGLYDNVTLAHDLAILKLQESVTYTEYIEPVCLPDTSITFGDDCYVIGWGETKETGDDEVLNEVYSPKHPQRFCNRYFARTISRPKLMGIDFCSGTTEADACYGDSGGPYNCQHDGHWYVVGVVSFGLDCAQPLHPGVYVNTTIYRRWIDHMIETL